MIVKAIYKDKIHNFFRDKVTKQDRKYGTLFECDDKLAEERIKKGLVKKATKKEEKEYIDSIETFDETDVLKDKEVSNDDQIISDEDKSSKVDDESVNTNDETIEKNEN